MSENESNSMVAIHNRYIYIYIQDGKVDDAKRRRKRETEKRKIEEQRRRRIRTKFLAHISRLVCFCPSSLLAGPL